LSAVLTRENLAHAPRSRGQPAALLVAVALAASAPARDASAQERPAAAPRSPRAPAAGPRVPGAPSAQAARPVDRASPAAAGDQSAPAATPPATPPGGADAAPPAQTEPAAARFEASLADVLNRPGGITEELVAARAAATSFDVRARHQEVLAAGAALDQALWGYIPRLTLSARYARLSDLTPPSFGNLVAAPAAPTGPLPAGTPLQNVPFTIPIPLNNASFQASLDVPLSDYLFRLSQSYAAATRSRRAAELTERAAQARAGFDARVAYWNLVRARLSTVVAEQALAQSHEHLTDVRNMARAGAVSVADVVRVESQVASAELLALRAQDLVAVTADQVRTATHAPDDAALDIGEDVRAEIAPLTGQNNFAALFDEAIGRRPEILALSETLGALRAQVEVSRAAGYPHFNAFADVLSALPNPRVFPPTEVFTTTWDVGVSLSWSPNDLGTALAGTRGANARAAQAEAQRAALRDQLRSEVMQAFLAVREAEAAIRTSDSGLAAAEESYRVRRVLFRNGRATSVELTDAETDLTRARLDAFNARVDLRIARVRLNHATGRDVPPL
jgi:outer membrane protein TolC